MIERLKGKDGFLKLMLMVISAIGIYLIVAWASYSPLDNGWTVASSAVSSTLNRTGALGAWCIDLLYAMFGKVAFLVPFVLTFVPIYYLMLGRTLQWQWLTLAARTGSFSALMIGLTMLAHTLLSNTAEYLSGGFIGSLFSGAVESVLGLFGALFIAMILTIVGFYFCSAQTLLQLGSRLYQWVITDPQPTRANEPKGEEQEEQAVENPQEFANEPQSEEPTPSATVSIEPTLTDVSQFSRPNIIGLKAAEDALDLPTVSLEGAVPPPPSVPKEILTNLSQFAPKKPLARAEQAVELSENFANTEVEVAPALPTIRLDNISAPELEETPVENPTAMPTVRLNRAPVVEVVEEPETAPMIPAFAQPQVSLNPAPIYAEPEIVEEDEDDQLEELARQFAEQEAERLREMEQRAKAQGLDQTFQQIMETPKVVESLPSAKVEHTIKVEKPVEVKPTTPAESAPNAYPKGYGDTLIHPLLQQPTRAEKPTTPLPSLDLLKMPPIQAQQITEQEILETSQRLENELANFGVKATVEDVLVGPVVTRYEIQTAPGTKAAKIMGLGPDLARALVFDAIRITDKVPNKPYMGIEAPNAQREVVWLRDVLDSEEFRNSKATLPMALGKDISGNPVVVDMEKMPHLLVAGQTGSGKSVGVNTMILSLIYKLTPEQVRFIMIDPKVVELAIYDNIPHLLTPVVTDMKKAANALNWAVEEMERRYALLSVLSVRNIAGYNSKIDYAINELKQPIPNPLWRPGDSMDNLPPPLEKLSYIVLIVDEFADLLMTEGKKVEEHIQRITQKARAVGIHLILATQRPSTDVITGVIKANIPSRIAFTVATQIDSRTILDRGGAESLLNRGDMLYKHSSDIMRVHGAFMSDDDVQRVADDWRARGKPDYIDAITESAENEYDGETGGNRGGDLDPLFDEVAAFVVETNVTSISGIQRRFSLGFNRAAKIIDQMEAEGIVSAPDSRSKREVLAR